MLPSYYFSSMYPYIFTHCLFDELVVSTYPGRLRFDSAKFPEFWVELQFDRDLQCRVVGRVPDFMQPVRQRSTLVVLTQRHGDVLKVCVESPYTATKDFRYSCSVHYPNVCYCIGNLVRLDWLKKHQTHVFTAVIAVSVLAEVVQGNDDTCDTAEMIVHAT